MSVGVLTHVASNVSPGAGEAITAALTPSKHASMRISFTLGGTGGGIAFLAHVGGFLFGWALLKMLITVKGGRGSTPDGGQRVYRVHW